MLIIQSKASDLTEGMFAQALTWLLEILNDLENEKKIDKDTKILFDVNTVAYDNLIPTFIVPKQQIAPDELQNAQTIKIKEYKSSHKIDFEFNENSFDNANRIWNKYFRFAPEVMNAIPIFDNTNTLGIHYRGTDKIRELGEANPITQEEFICIVEDFLQSNQHFKNIYCASDEQSFMEVLKCHFPDMNIIEYNQNRSNSIEALHKMKDLQKATKDANTLAALIDMIALSRCDCVIKTNSALSSFSKILNPKMQLVTTSAMKQRWFPTGVVKPYRSSSRVVNLIMQRTMYGHVYF
jgi:hypothetical protein